MSPGDERARSRDRGGRGTSILVLALVVAASVRPGASDAQAAPGARTPEEAEALELLENGLMVSARTQAERVLSRDPSSIVGHYVLGRVFFDAEGSLARALYHFGRARELYERGAPAPSDFHQQLLFQTARLAGQMELYEYQLELLGYHDHLYDPDLVAERCWPLMKLGRMQEARELAMRAAGSPNVWQRSAGLNALCAVEGEARTREPYFEACRRALADARVSAARRGEASDEDAAGITVDAYNAALAAAAALRFREAEELALEGVRRFEPTSANPWRLLVELYLSSGRTDDALTAFSQMIAWNDRQPASLRDQNRAENEATVALVLWIAGESELALERIDRAIERPDRRGLTTEGAEQARGRHALLRSMIRRTLAEQEAERASWTGRGAQALRAALSIADAARLVPDEERVTAVLTDERRLVDTLRPYVPGGIDGLSPWITGELVRVLGPAVVSVALREARRLDASSPAAAAAYFATEAEIAAARGDADRAVSAARRALASLDAPGWALLRARVAAVAASAAEESGDTAAANELFATAMEIDPGVLRRLGLSLPAQVVSSGGADAEEAASLLERSPRIDEREGGFVIAVTSTTATLRACLRTPSHNELSCAQVPRALPEDAPEEEKALTPAQRLAREAHRQLFGARVRLSGVDLGSLDGRAQGGSRLANERLRELIRRDAVPR